VLARLQEILIPEAESGTVLARLNLRVIASMSLRRAPQRDCVL